MRVWPVLLESEPVYLHGHASETSLLLAPLGTETVFERLRRWLAGVAHHPPMVFTPRQRGQTYRDRMAAECVDARVVTAGTQFADAVAALELSDVLLLIDPQCLPKRDPDLTALLRQYSADSRLSQHLIVFEKGVGGTKERVSLDASGHVRGIRRYYEPATWPFVTGVAAMLLPVACEIGGGDIHFQSLTELRRTLAARGVPARDTPIEGGAYDLTESRGFLAASEDLVLAAAAARSGTGGRTTPVLVGSGHLIAATARLVGPVVVHAGARIDRQATILGPTIIGAGARVHEGAVVAHAAIGPGMVVRGGSIMRDGVFFASSPARNAEDVPVPTGSYAEKLDHLSVDQDPRDYGSDPMPPRGFPGKRFLDAVIAATALLFFAPFLAIIAIVVWLESRGPILYGDEREGRGGRVFRCWKFRTMIPGAHAAQQHLTMLDHTDGPHFKVHRDPRVTRVGRLLRAANLDELPQFFNVLVGQMSLVGPRPSPFRENQLCVPWREARLSVRPGITGLWQVCRHDRAAGDFHQWIEYDLLYVQHLSLTLDLKIIFATVLTLAGKLHVPLSWIVSPAELVRAARPTAVEAVRSDVKAVPSVNTSEQVPTS